MELLPAELVLKIFSFLHEDDIYQVSLVCSCWNQLCKDGELWRILSQNLSQCCATKHRIIPPNDFQAPLDEWKALYRDFGDLCNPKDQISLIQDALAASSTDEEERQGVDQTLEDSDSFWSSAGYDDVNSEDWVTYKLVQPLCIINSIDISVFNAYFQAGSPTYAPQRVQIFVGYDDTTDWDSIEFKSEEFTIQNTSDTQRFHLQPRMVMGGFIAIRLLGKCSLQPGDELFYTVLRHVVVWGIPIGSIVSPVLRKCVLDYCAISPKFVNDIRSRYSSLSKENPYIHDFNIENENSNILEEERKKMILIRVMDIFVYEMRDSKGLGRIREHKLNELKQLITYKSWADVVQLVCDQNPLLNLRGRETLDLIREMAGIPGLNSYYVHLTLLQKPLSEEESIGLANLAATSSDSGQFHTMFVRACLSRRLLCSKRVGDATRQIQKALAMTVYMNGNCFDCVVDVAAEIGRFNLVFDIWHSITSCKVHYETVIKRVQECWGDLIAYRFALRLCNQDHTWGIEATNNAFNLGIDKGDRQVMDVITERILSLADDGSLVLHDRMQ